LSHEEEYPKLSPEKGGEKMEYLATVRDGSEEEPANRYWMLHVIGTLPESPAMLPL